MSESVSDFILSVNEKIKELEAKLSEKADLLEKIKEVKPKIYENCLKEKFKNIRYNLPNQ